MKSTLGKEWEDALLKVGRKNEMVHESEYTAFYDLHVLTNIAILSNSFRAFKAYLHTISPQARSLELFTTAPILLLTTLGRACRLSRLFPMATLPWAWRSLAQSASKCSRNF